MNYLFVIFCVLASQCTSQPVDESVVSVYTTPTGPAAPLDVYRQIASNIAERITSPIYRLFGINATTAAPKRNFDHIELDEDKDFEKKPEMKPLNNEITQERDVEELSQDALKKVDKKPEKITLYTTYLPVAKPASNTPTMRAELTANNESTTEFDEFDPFEDFPEEKSREGGFVYFLETFGSFIQLVWGGIMSIFKPNSS